MCFLVIVVPVAHPDPPLSSHLHPSCPPLDLLMPPLTSQGKQKIKLSLFPLTFSSAKTATFIVSAEESLATHLPHRTRDSFVLTTEHGECSGSLYETHISAALVASDIFCSSSSQGSSTLLRPFTDNTPLTDGGLIIQVGRGFTAQEIPRCCEEQEQGDLKSNTEGSRQHQNEQQLHSLASFSHLHQCFPVVNIFVSSSQSVRAKSQRPGRYCCFYSSRLTDELIHYFPEFSFGS